MLGGLVFVFVGSVLASVVDDALSAEWWNSDVVDAAAATVVIGPTVYVMMHHNQKHYFENLHITTTQLEAQLLLRNSRSYWYIVSNESLLLMPACFEALLFVSNHYFRMSLRGVVFFALMVSVGDWLLKVVKSCSWGFTGRQGVAYRHITLLVVSPKSSKM